MRNAKLFALAGIASAGLLAAAPLGAAQAVTHPQAVSGHVYYTCAVADNSPNCGSTANPVAGYAVSEAVGGAYFTHIDGYFGDNASTSMTQLATGYTDGQNLSLCNDTSSAVAQLGAVVNGTDTKSVGWHITNYGTADSNQDPCENGTTFSGLGTFNELQTVPITDTVVGDIQYYTHKHEACPIGDVDFQAQDITADPGHWWDSGCQYAGPDAHFNQAYAFNTRDSEHLSPPATNYLDTFAHLGVTDSNGTHGSFQASTTWTAYPVVATANGLSSDQPLVAVSPFSQDHFDVLVAGADS